MVDHIHCIICGKPHIVTKDEYDENNNRPKSYVCVECMESFETDYILHRIKCEREGVFNETFWKLETRLSAYRSEDYENGNIGTYIF